METQIEQQREEVCGVDKLTGLTPIQEQAAILLASGETITAVATKIGVNRGTIYDWQNSLTFKCYFNRQRYDYKEHLRNSIYGLTNDAIEAVKSLIKSDNETIRLKTAIWLLDRIEGGKTGEINVRDALRAQCTSGMFDCLSDYSRFDKEAYQYECIRLGIDP